MPPQPALTVTLLGQPFPVKVPSPSICRDVLVAAGTNDRRAALAALALCVELPVPDGKRPLDRMALRALGYHVLDFAEVVEERLDALGSPWREYMAAARTCFEACDEAGMPTVVEVVSRVDFGTGRDGEVTSSPSASASSTAGTRGGSTG